MCPYRPILYILHKNIIPTFRQDLQYQLIQSHNRLHRLQIPTFFHQVSHANQRPAHQKLDPTIYYPSFDCALTEENTAYMEVSLGFDVVDEEYVDFALIKTMAGVFEAVLGDFCEDLWDLGFEHV